MIGKKFWAIRNNREFVADDPLRLLGIISIWENYGDGWYEQRDSRTLAPYEDRNLHDEIITRAFPENAEEIENLSEKEFIEYTSDYRLFFSRFTSKEIIPANTTRRAFYTIIDNFYKVNDEGLYDWI